jgi:hypothetical protein
VETVPLIYLLDPSGQAWQVTVTNDPVIQYSKVSNVAAVTGIFLNDVSQAVTWRLTITTTGVLQQTSVNTICAQSELLVYSPNGNLYGIQVNLGVVDIVAATLCAFALSDALAALADRLYDPTMQFWSQPELIIYIQEAMQTWNALTSYWRGDFTFQSQQGVTFYDITDSTIAPNTLRSLNQTIATLATVMEYHLLEPVTGLGLWTGSLQFNVSDIESAITRRRDETLGVTGCTYTHRQAPADPGRTLLSASVLDLRRVAFFPEQGAMSLMFQDDTWGMNAYEPYSTTQPQGTPQLYLVSTQPLLSFDVDTPPVPGQYDLLTIESGYSVNEGVACPSTLSIPDDWAWIVKWGALADLLGRESNAKDLLRAKYCEGRYKQGLQLLAAASAVLALRSNNIPLQVDAVKSADLYNPLWQGSAQGSPQEGLTAGLNLVALSPPPDAGPYSITTTVVENAPIPVNLTDCLQLTQDVYDVIIDYAQHLAAFKMGGEEFTMTESLLQRFMQMAALYSSKLAEQGEFTKILYGMSQNEANMNPRYTPDSDPAAGGSQ